MPLYFAVIALIAGFALLIYGADWLVEGGSAIARRLRISDLVIGLTIVSFGTSAPELLVNLVASFRGNTDIAIGNIVGSNIANSLLILGATAAITRLYIERSTVFKEIPFCLLGAVTLCIMANDSIVDGYPIAEVGRGDGLLLLSFFIIFMYYTFGIASGNHEEHTKEHKPLWLAVLLVIVGCTALAAGGEIAVRGATSIALALGISEAIIGVTVIAVGTSLPELVTSVKAGIAGKSNIAVGNVVGSNIFNIFWILGVSATIKPLPFDPSWNPSLIVVVLSTVLLFAFTHMGTQYRNFILWHIPKDGHTIDRWQGWVLLLCYAGYVGYIATTV